MLTILYRLHVAPAAVPVVFVSPLLSRHLFSDEVEHISTALQLVFIKQLMQQLMVDACPGGIETSDRVLLLSSY